ncbi:cation-transporting P-type ATPase [Zobellella denitrificans]|uniref:cation-transporting P-type ATPase n=1 Tax=Zobellella denitrificans TaxID=347534 RepID=UPI001C3D1C1B|nr:cation-transporting P-type ATPase [Zobellella denitrificans]
MQTSAPRWHRLTTEQTASALDTDSGRGLSDQAARQRLAEYGENRLAETAPRPPGSGSWISSRPYWCWCCCLPPGWPGPSAI